MPTPIPHAEVLIGIAEGKTAQTTSAGNWVSPPDPRNCNPLTHPHWEWRLKPGPKVVKVRVYQVGWTRDSLSVPSTVFPSVESAEEHGRKYGYTWLSPWHDIEVTE